MFTRKDLFCLKSEIQFAVIGLEDWDWAQGLCLEEWKWNLCCFGVGCLVRSGGEQFCPGYVNFASAWLYMGMSFNWCGLKNLIGVVCLLPDLHFSLIAGTK